MVEVRGGVDGVRRRCAEKDQSLGADRNEHSREDGLSDTLASKCPRHGPPNETKVNGEWHHGEQTGSELVGATHRADDELSDEEEDEEKPGETNEIDFFLQGYPLSLGRILT